MCGSLCISSDPKLDYRNSESISKFEVKIRLLDIYQMSEDGVYLSSIPSFLGMSSSKRPVPDPILGLEVARCSNGMVRGVVQLVQNWFAGIPNPIRSLRLV